MYLCCINQVKFTCLGENIPSFWLLEIHMKHSYLQLPYNSTAQPKLVAPSNCKLVPLGHPFLTPPPPILPASGDHPSTLYFLGQNCEFLTFSFPPSYLYLKYYFLEGSCSWKANGKEFTHYLSHWLLSSVPTWSVFEL